MFGSIFTFSCFFSLGGFSQTKAVMYKLAFKNLLQSFCKRMKTFFAN